MTSLFKISHTNEHFAFGSFNNQSVCNILDPSAVLFKYFNAVLAHTRKDVLKSLSTYLARELRTVNHSGKSNTRNRAGRSNWECDDHINFHKFGNGNFTIFSKNPWVWAVAFQRIKP